MEEISNADMDKQEGFSTNRAPMFDVSNYTFWEILMGVYLKSLGMDIWKLVEDGYKFRKETTNESKETDENIVYGTTRVDQENTR